MQIPTRSRAFAGALAVVLSSLTLALVPGGPASAATQKTCTPPSASDSFEKATPDQVGIDAAKLKKAVNAHSLRVRLSIQVFRNNCLVATGPLEPITDKVHNDLWSVTKSVVSLLTGIASGDGKLKLDDPIGKYLPTGKGWGDEAHRAITIRQLLTQTSGLDQSILAEALTLGVDPSLPQQALAQPFVYKPGTTFQYSQLGPALLAYVVQRAVGQDLVEYAQERLFTPIGIKSGKYFWLRDRSGNAYGYAHLFLTPPQLARLGLLMSNNGKYRGKQVVPAAYIKAVSKPNKTNGCYGLLFWTNAGKPCTGADITHAQTLDRHAIPSAPLDAYEMNGTGGQLVIMIPSLKLTVVTTGYFGSIALDPPVLLGAAPDEMQWTFFRDLMKAIPDAKVPDPGRYRGDPIDLDINPTNYINPAVLLRSLLANPGCNILVCNGSVPTKGLIQNVQSLTGLL